MKVSANDNTHGGIVKIKANPDKRRFKAESGMRNYHRDDSAKARGRNRRILHAE